MMIYPMSSALKYAARLDIYIWFIFIWIPMHNSWNTMSYNIYIIRSRQHERTIKHGYLMLFSRGKYNIFQNLVLLLQLVSHWNEGQCNKWVFKCVYRWTVEEPRVSWNQKHQLSLHFRAIYPRHYCFLQIYKSEWSSSWSVNPSQYWQKRFNRIRLVTMLRINTFSFYCDLTEKKS